MGGKCGGRGLDGKPLDVSLRLRGVDGEFTVMTQSEVNALDTPFLRGAIKLYNRWKLLKALPHGQGTNGERESVLEILETLEGEGNAFDAWKMDHKDDLIEDTALEG